MKLARFLLVNLVCCLLVLLTAMKSKPHWPLNFAPDFKPPPKVLAYQTTNLPVAQLSNLPVPTLPKPTTLPEIVPNLVFNQLQEPNHIFIPGFHDFGPNARLGGMTYGEFDAYVQRVKDLGYQNLTTQKLLDLLYGKTPLQGKWVLFTFDDGYSSQFEAANILHRHGYTALLGIISNHIVTGGQKLNQPQIAELLAQGHELASHTSEHCPLTLPAANHAHFQNNAPGPWQNCDPDRVSLLSREEVAYQLLDSKTVMEKMFGIPVKSIIYPYGYYNDTTYQEGVKAGYVLGFRFPSRVNRDVYSYSNSLALPRMNIQRGARL
jgi:peptidoglycan/xylan/chitin deacetylase (PgdA/CDA1 family)